MNVSTRIKICLVLHYNFEGPKDSLELVGSRNDFKPVFLDSSYSNLRIKKKLLKSRKRPKYAPVKSTIKRKKNWVFLVHS